MFYAFIVLVVVLLIGVIYFAILKAKNKSQDYYMNMLLLKRYNELIKKYFKHINQNNIEKYLLRQEEVDQFDETHIIKNIETIKQIEKNFYLIKKNLDKKQFDKVLISQLEKISPLWICKTDFTLNQINNSYTKILNLANSIKKTRLSEEISKCFGNAVVYQLDDFILLLKNKVVIIDIKDIFEIKLLSYEDFQLDVNLKDCHEVLYDGNDPLEELDFRQENLNVEGEGEANIETYVKCYVYEFQAKYLDKEYKTKFHIMNVNYNKKLSLLIKKQKEV